MKILILTIMIVGAIFVLGMAMYDGWKHRHDPTE